ncbi:FAD binding domain-containing protein [Gaeumannomyces tritici R3-111a-1]|uniref:FAD binding domain-containing protein n=1 Tax=Gaeumannomyces tritici (strain R3-111a-1) TaxID=644352 RepID=J3P6B3_GAET3|nr:FAD binding domain-containing protein [Gaeumannomyces tritici R3-111a-1]EJT72187.1 FAD binding domain-containing protein [Gaeumannomyces tritici R3-111a-1]
MQLRAITVAYATMAMLSSGVLAKSDTCKLIKTQSSSIAEYSGIFNREYNKETGEYWSQGCAGLKPDCVLEPQNAQEVSQLMKVLAGNSDEFAIKSGGHNPNNRYASVKDGVLISTKKMNEVTIDRARGVVTVGPGNRWDDVFKGLEGSGLAVVGGRMGNVGVGGFLLGGGLSFLSTQYGWAANNIVEFELVTPNGTIATVSADKHPDVFEVLKGGGNNFGIVTKYVLKAHPIGKVWGGNVMYGKEKTGELLALIRDFTEHYDDPKAAIIATVQLTVLNAIEMWTLFLFYDGPTPPAGIFDKFDKVGPTINNCKTREYGELLSYNNWAVLHGSRYVIATETTPLPPASDNGNMMRAYFDHWRSTSKKRAGELGIISSMAFQPIPKSLTRIARASGGDMLDLDDAADRIMFEFNYSYLLGTSDKAIDKTTVELTTGIKSLVDGFVQAGRLPNVHNPLFLNDAYYRQGYFSRLRPEKRQKAVNVRKNLDPQGLFALRTGGPKV